MVLARLDGRQMGQELVERDRKVAYAGPAGVEHRVAHRCAGSTDSQLAETLRTEDAGEGIQAFFQKRPPEFRGR